MSGNCLNIGDLRKAYARNENIAQLLSEQGWVDREEVIEISYDIQSGSYTNAALSDPDRLQRYAKEIHDLCNGFISDHDSILDCGGELTTLSALSRICPSTCDYWLAIFL